MNRLVASCAVFALFLTPLFAQVAIRAEKIYPVAGSVIENGTILVRDGRIEAVGAQGEIEIPEGYTEHRAAVVTPGLVDAHSVVGLSGYLNQDHDQDQVEDGAPIQPQLRAIDAYNPRERLVEWVRSFGVTTLHTGHGPGNLISGQTLIVKTVGDTVSEAVMVDFATIAATLGSAARESGKSPGTRSKAVAMLRSKLLSAQEYLSKAEGEEEEKPPRDLEQEALAAVLKREVPLLITVDRAHDILSALRVAEEFEIDILLDSAAEAYLVLDEIKQAGVPVILHPTMSRSYGERENLSMETAARLVETGIPMAIQSGFEGYVPKTRVVLLEAALAAANGLGFENALAAITLWPAQILGVDERVGSIEVGKDADLVLFDGDPFEYTTHVTQVFIEGAPVSGGDSEWR